LGIQIHVSTDSLEEFEALESEGAPCVSMGSGRFVRITSLFGINTRPEVEQYYSGELDPEILLGVANEARTRALLEGEFQYLAGDPRPVNTDYEGVKTLIEIARVAKRLGRKISWG
jgi:hypothetical protein